MLTIAIDAWNQTGIIETSMTCRSAASISERNDATLKVAIIKSSAFEPGILKREGNDNRFSNEISPTIRSQMGDNQTSIVSFSAKPGEMIRLSEKPKTSKEVSQTLTRSDGKLGDNQPTVIAFTHDTREEVHSLDNAVGTLSICAGISCLNPTQPQTHRIYEPNGVFPAIMANTGMAGQDQSAILNSNQNKIQQENNMKAEVRRLTPKETSRLMGMPDNHLAIHGQETSASSIYSCNGNGWARNCSRLVFKNIHKVDEKICGTRRSFKIGSVSSGQGTHEMSIQDFGDKSIFCADIAPFPCEVLAVRFPNMPNFGDVTRISYDAEKKVIHNRKKDDYSLMPESQLGFNPIDAPTVEIPLEYGEMDCISGGLPCTDVSVAGKRAGATEGSGTRSALAYELPRIGKETGCKWLCYENVAGLVSSNGGIDLAWFLYRLHEAGYSVAWRMLDAQYVRCDMHPRAVPQRRRRIWLVGYRGDDWRVPCEALFEPMKALGNEPPKRTVGIGYLTKTPHDTNAEPEKTELEEFQEFINNANQSILTILTKNGVCESPEARIRELKVQANVNSDANSFNLFSGDLFGTPEEKHQGRGLKASDLQLNFPNNADIRSISQVELYQWAKTICNEIEYFGDIFKKHKGAPTADDLQPKMLENIGNAGFLCNGLVCTMKMPEWNAGVTEEELATMPKELAELYDGDVCGLSDILEENPDPKYKLSWRACYGILRRAVNRGKKLPIELGYALVERIIEQAPFVKWIATYGKDTVKKESDVSERQIAKDAFNTYINLIRPWTEVKEAEPNKSNDEPMDESEDDADGEDNGDTEEE